MAKTKDFINALSMLPHNTTVAELASIILSNTGAFSDFPPMPEDIGGEWISRLGDRIIASDEARRAAKMFLEELGI